MSPVLPRIPSSPTQLRSLAATAAEAPPECERQLLETAIGSLVAEPSPRRRIRLRRLLHSDTPNELAIEIFGSCLKGYGFEIGAIPAAGRPTGQSKVWKPGDPYARVYRARTPALALIRACAAEAARLVDTETLRACSRCNGQGWFITRSNTRQICRHDEQAA